MLHLELSCACPVFLSCQSLLTKPPFVCQITVRCVCCHVNGSYTIHCTPHCSSHVSQTKCTTAVTVTPSLTAGVCILIYVTSLNGLWSFVCEWYRPKTDIIWNIKCLLLGEIRKIFQSKCDPRRGRNFHSGTSVPPLKFLYVWPVFRNKLGSFIFHSDWKVLFLFLLFDFLFSFPMVNSTFRVSFNTQTLTSCNEKLFLSKLSQYESTLN